MIHKVVVTTFEDWQENTVLPRSLNLTTPLELQENAQFEFPKLLKIMAKDSLYCILIDTDLYWFQIGCIAIKLEQAILKIVDPHRIVIRTQWLTLWLEQPALMRLEILNWNTGSAESALLTWFCRIKTFYDHGFPGLHHSHWSPRACWQNNNFEFQPERYDGSHEPWEHINAQEFTVVDS